MKHLYLLLVIISSLLITTHSLYGQSSRCGNNNKQGKDASCDDESISLEELDYELSDNEVQTFSTDELGNTTSSYNSCEPSQSKVREIREMIREERSKKCAGVNKFDPYTGNVHREVRDLQLWGTVGDDLLVWTRYFNSRSKDPFGHWDYSYHYKMFEEDSTNKITIQYPEGGENTFTQSETDLSLWLPPFGINKRLFQDGNNFFLQLANGFRYRFEKLIDEQGDSYYQLQDFKDTKQNLYKLTYNSSRDLKRVTEPAGRYLEINYETKAGKKVISKVTGSDGRSVEYSNIVIEDSISSTDAKDNTIKIKVNWIWLSAVIYGDGTFANYNFYKKEAGREPNLSYASDPRFVGNTPIMKYTYNYGEGIPQTVTGFIKEEINGITEKVMATLEKKDDKSIVCYANGRKQTFIQPTALEGLEDEISDELGRVTKYTYFQDQGQNGFLKTITKTIASNITNNPVLFHQTTYFDSVTVYDNPIQVTHSDFSKEKWTRDDLDLVLTHTDELQRTTTYTRDSKHRITDIEYPDSTTESFTYNDFGQVLTHTRRNKAVEEYKYDNRGLRKSFKDAMGNITYFFYNKASLLDSIKDARRNTTKYEYNERGLLTKLTHPDNSFQTYEYDDFGNRTKVTDELGHIWQTKFDEFNRIISTTDPLNRQTVYRYNLLGETCGCAHADNKPTQIILPSQRTIDIEYDEEWEKIKETVAKGSPDEASTFYEYDEIGNLAAKIDPLGKTWIYTYDDRNRRTSATDPLGNETSWSHDVAGNLTIIRYPGPDYHYTEYDYDGMNRVKVISEKMKFDATKVLVTNIIYDAEGNMFSLTDPKNNTYNFNYDSLNRKTKMIYPNGSFESYTYDEVGNLKTYKAIAGQVRTYTYDNRNRERSFSWTSPFKDDITPAVARTYDDANRLLTLTSTVSSLTYTYNDANEQISETQNITGAAGAKTVNYTYNDDGLRETIMSPYGNLIIHYDYTGRNQIASIAAGDLTVPYTYDLNGNRVTKILGNGTSTAYSYDDANRLLTLDNLKGAESFAKFEYGYDNASRRKFVKRDNDRGDVYTYDAIDQVTNVYYDVSDPSGTPTNPVRTVNYVYDSAGNRTMVTDNGIPTSYTPNNLNQYVNIGDSSAQYFRNKNLKSFNGWIYKYDAQNRLINAQNGTTTVTFAYDPLNRCVKRTVNGTTTFLYYDEWNLIEERGPGDGLQALYIHGAQVDEILVKLSPGSIIYYHQDALGSVTHLTDEKGDVIEKYSYDVFGKPTIFNSNRDIIETSAFGNRFLFTGRDFIQEIGMYDYRNRMYSPTLGRFLQIDPIRLSGGDYNLYRYVSNNTVNVSDPFGLSPCDQLEIAQNNYDKFDIIQTWTDHFKKNINNGIFIASSIVTFISGNAKAISEGIDLYNKTGASKSTISIKYAAAVAAAFSAGYIVGSMLVATALTYDEFIDVDYEYVRAIHKKYH